MDQNRRSRTKNSCSGENASAKNRSDTQEDRRRNSTEGFQPWGLVGFAGLECQSGHKAHREDVQSGLPVTGLLPGRLSQRLIHPVLPSRTFSLEVFKNVPIYPQRHNLFRIRKRGPLWSYDFGRLCRRCFESRFCHLYRVSWSPCSVESHCFSSKRLGLKNT